MTSGIAAFALPKESTFHVSHIGCPHISVASIPRSLEFFTAVLDFHVAGQEESSALVRLAPGMPRDAKAHTAHLILGEECLDLTEYSFPKGLSFPADSHGNDRWFQHIAIVVSDLDEAYGRLRKAQVQFVSNVPQTLPVSNREAAGISAFYFRDPDGHYLELIHFPPGKGAAKWQAHSASVFLGIDHTAITVADTARSLAFYRDQLHLHVAGGSENYGSEQEHLSGVFNAHVLITSLRAESGIGIELLEYLSPHSGRPIRENQRISDLASWQVPLDVDPSQSDLGNKGVAWQRLPLNSQNDLRAAWLKDPDGHWLELITK